MKNDVATSTGIKIESIHNGYLVTVPDGYGGMDPMVKGLFEKFPDLIDSVFFQLRQDIGFAGPVVDGIGGNVVAGPAVPVVPIIPVVPGSQEKKIAKDIVESVKNTIEEPGNNLVQMNEVYYFQTREKLFDFLDNYLIHHELKNR